MAEKTRTGVRAGQVEPEAGFRQRVNKVSLSQVSEVGLALLYLLSFAAVGFCGGSGDGPVAVVGAAGLLVAIGVCVVAALRGQLFTSVLLMAVLMVLVALTDPVAVPGSAAQLVGE